MNFLTLVALLTLTLTDPSGDAIGGGSLEPPTSPIYANTAQFDLLGVELHTPEAAGAVVGSLDANGVDADDLDPDSLAAGRPADGRPAAGTASRLTISLGSLPARRNSLDEIDQEEAAPTSDATDGAQAPLREAAAAGDLDDDGPVVEEDFDLSALLTVIDVYIGVAGGSSDVGAVSGLDRTLDGPNMLMPLGQGWRHAVRVSADGAMAITYVDPPAPTGEEHPEARLIVEPLGVTRRGNDLIMELPWRIEGDVDLYALSGVHDPFSASGWRQLSSQPSPWAFSGDGQVPPVIDLIAPDAAAQSAALASGVLPRPPKPEVGFTLPRTPWPYLMLGGLLLAVVGLVMRGRVPAPKEAADAEVGDEADATSSDAESDAELTAPVADDGDAAAPGGVAAETPATETLAAQTTGNSDPYN